MQKQKKLKLHKARYTALAAVSVDGRISTNTKKMPDWTSPEDWKFFQDKMRGMDAIVAGRATYEAAKKHIDKRVAYVLTSRVTKPVKKGTVTFVNPKYTNLAELLGGYKNVAIVGGADVYRTMFDLGLCDELYLTIEPVALGHGRELFGKGKVPMELKLISTKKLNTKGTIVLRYEVLH